MQAARNLAPVSRELSGFFCHRFTISRIKYKTYFFRKQLYVFQIPLGMQVCSGAENANIVAASLVGNCGKLLSWLRMIRESRESCWTSPQNTWVSTPPFRILRLIITISYSSRLGQVFQLLTFIQLATAPYFYGSILLRALASKIIVVLTYVSKKKFLSY